jgi:hypothetical protein
MFSLLMSGIIARLIRSGYFLIDAGCSDTLRLKDVRLDQLQKDDFSFA